MSAPDEDLSRLVESLAKTYITPPQFRFQVSAESHAVLTMHGHITAKQLLKLAEAIVLCSETWTGTDEPTFAEAVERVRAAIRARREEAERFV